MIPSSAVERLSHPQKYYQWDEEIKHKYEEKQVGSVEDTGFKTYAHHSKAYWSSHNTQ